MRIDMDNAISLLNIKKQLLLPNFRAVEKKPSDWEENQYLSGFTLTKKSSFKKKMFFYYFNFRWKFVINRLKLELLRKYR